MSSPKLHRVSYLRKMAQFSLLVLLAVALLPSPSLSQVLLEEPKEELSLVVLIRAGQSEISADHLVKSAHRGDPLPGSFRVLRPKSVVRLLGEQGRLVERGQLDVAPGSPVDRSLRFVLLTFETPKYLEQAERVLSQDTAIEAIERVKPGHYSFSPIDPLFSKLNPNGTPRQPTQYQWGSHVLNLPAAWNRTKGWGYVGAVDSGVDVDHPDLRAWAPGFNIYQKGNFRPHLSCDMVTASGCVVGASVDEGVGSPASRGHGTHVSGTISATWNNTGAAGICRDCSLLMGRARFLNSITGGRALTALTDLGAQAINMSFGLSSSSTFFQDQINYAAQRDVLLVAASGNAGVSPVEYPASESAVVAAGGAAPASTPTGWSFWTNDPTGVGSNWGAQQELVTPARNVLSTFYPGFDWNPTVQCGDSFYPALSGYGLCTGTSMASPHAVGAGMMVRSVNPLLRVSNVRAILKATASNGGVFNTQLGWGMPNVALAVDKALGVADAQTLKNRLTPLFTHYSSAAKAHIETSVPQQAMAATHDATAPYSTAVTSAPTTPGYTAYPDTSCPTGGGCTPRAWLYVFTTARAPYTGAPPLVPLYRMSYRGAWNGNINNRSFAYTTEKAGLEAFHAVGYELDGVEGFIYQRCTPEPTCIPTGATRVYRLYSNAKDDYVLVGESKKNTFLSQGYIFPGGANAWIGYAYENLDSDADKLINGFETLIGTNPSVKDSDCDGIWDGNEIRNTYPNTDPLDGPCGP